MASAAVRDMRDIAKLGVASTDTMCERLLSFVAAYQQQNNGATPGWACIANQLGIIEEGVRPLVARLETRGLLHIVSRNPLRLMLTQPGQPNPAEPFAADMAAAKPGAYGRFLDAEGERMRLGRFIGDFERRTGHGPSLRQMIDFVGWAEPARVTRMAEMLAEKGIIQFGRNVPTQLTALGRQVFNIKGAKPMEQQEKKARAKPVIVMVNRRPPRERVNALCEALAARIRANDDDFGNYVRYSDLAQDLGYGSNSSGTVSHIARAAIAAGYLKPKPRKSHGLFFTEKGLAKFMPELVPLVPPPAEAEEAPAMKPVEPESYTMETPIVAQVAAVVAPSANAGTLNFSLTGNGLSVTGKTASRAELAAFIGKLGALMPFLGE